MYLKIANPILHLRKDHFPNLYKNRSTKKKNEWGGGNPIPLRYLYIDLAPILVINEVIPQATQVSL
jgi:hypothetical protein